MQTMAPWIDAIGWTLLHFVWQGLVVGAGFAAARALIPTRASEARYAAGLVALALLAASPLLTLVALWPSAGAALGDMAAHPVIAAADAQISAADWSGTIAAALPWLVAVWGAGVCLCAAHALREWHRLDRVVRRFAASHESIDAMVASIMARFDFRHRVRALVSDSIDTPMLIGWIKPVILLPTAVALGFPRQQVELILAHELGHLRRHDHLVNLAQAVLETVLFYHPVVHWISREVRNERELCCDHLVLRTMRGEPREYARTLAALEELRLVAPLALAANGGELLERVRRIVGIAAAPRVAVEGRSSGRWLLVAAGVLMAWTFAQRIERADLEVFVPAGPGIDWVHAPSAAVPSFAAVIAPQKLAKWRVPNIAVVPAADAATVAAPATVAVTERIPAPAAPAVADLVPSPAAPAVLAAAVAPAAVAKATPAPAPAAVELAHPSKPVAIHTVAPEFPGYARLERVTVDASFTIAADGSVRDIRLQGRADSAFKREAERALRQWRFDPASLPADRELRYSQTFVFAPPGEYASREGCVRQTGSMVCRPGLDEVANRATD